MHFLFFNYTDRALESQLGLKPKQGLGPFP